MSRGSLRSCRAAWIGALAALGLGQGQPARAQDRMPLIAPEQLTAPQREAVAELASVRGIALRGPWIPLLRSPEVMRRARAMGDYLRYDSALPPRLSELLILLTAREWTQQYEWVAHRDIALEAGLAADIIASIAEGRRPASMGEEEAVLYELHTELVRQHSVSDVTYADAVRLFGEQGVIDAVGIIGYYTLLAMAMNTARTPVPVGMDPPLRPFPQ